MRTRNSNFPNNSNVTIPRRQNRGRAPNVVEPELRTIVEVAPMAERTVEELLRAPKEGENPYAHINSFKRITSTLRFRDVPNDVIKLMMLPYSLEGAAKVWYEKEPPNSILTWEDLVTKFVNQFFPPSKTTHLKNEISRFTQKFEETFSEAWERFKEMLRACPHHGFTELTQVDTFYNGLNENDQYSLNATAGGNLLSKTTREALNIIENKSKVCYSRNKSNGSRNMTLGKVIVKRMRDCKLADQILDLSVDCSKNVFLFEFDDNYNSSDINPLFKEILEDVESKDSNVSNFDEPVLLNTPLFDEDECFNPGGDNDEIDAFLAIKISTYIEEGYYDRWRCILSWKIA
ncbi:reverse transcriptase domain-containing protein [Tanacetum coccineum]